MMLKIVKDPEVKKHFLPIDKCHNSGVNYLKDLPINNQKETFLVQMHLQNLNGICL